MLPSKTGEDVFYAEVEPCLERITYVTVKEFSPAAWRSLYLVCFKNFGVGAVGENLLRDAKATGKTVAMVSAGDLASFSGDLHFGDRFKRSSKKEEEAAENEALDADILVYHWIVR